jgi:glycosyltransferase involved in cell wall biosynthesis
MNVTFLTGEYPPMQGGIADHTAYLAKHLTSLGVTSSVLTSRRWTAVGPADESDHAVVHPVLPDWSWRCWSATARFLGYNEPDVLHIQYQAAAFDLTGWVNWLPWYLQKRRKNTRIVTTFHDLRIPYIFPKAGRFRQKSILALAHYSDAVICTNQEDLHELSKASQTWTVSPQLTHIPLGSNVEPQPPANFNRAVWRARYNADEATLLLAYFGFLNESKGGEELIESINLLRQQGIKAHLLLIGGDVGHADPTNAAYAQKVQTLINKWGLAELVYRTGYVTEAEVSANLLAADVVVMPYRDGVSFRRTTLIAALHHGCPVISTVPRNFDYFPEIQPGENMLLVPPHDAKALAQTIAQLHYNPDLSRKLAAGAKSLGSLFEWSEIAGQTAALYQTLSRRNN